MSATAEGLSAQPMEPAALQVDGLSKLLESIVPSDTIEIKDVFLNTHTFPSIVSARSQIKLLREFDKIKNSDIGELTEYEMTNIVSVIIKLASNEDILKSLCNCFSIAHPKILETAKKYAKKKKYDYEDNEFAPADLFPLEELVAAILPLFLRLAKRGGSALAMLNT